MNSTTTSKLLKTVLENPALSSLLALAVWIAGVMTGSIPVIVASGLLAFGRPIFYSALLNAQSTTAKPAKTGHIGLTSVHSTAFGVR